MKELSINSGTIVTWDDEETLETNISVVPLEMAAGILTMGFCCFGNILTGTLVLKPENI